MPTLAQLYKRPIDTIKPGHLSHIVGEGNYVTIHFTDGSTVLFSKTLKLFEAQYPFLIRVSKSLAIAPGSITDWERIDKKTMRVEVAGVRHWVSRRRIDGVMAKLSEAITAATPAPPALLA
jgi:DNA-binding LytR/AlgR family response regulator